LPSGQKKPLLRLRAREPKQKTPVSFPTEAFVFSVLTRYLPLGAPVVPRNSANSVELLILVTNQGSGAMLDVGCSWMTRPTGVGP
jgi:hypothetical protein